jgi:hypothetical protein
MRRFSGFIRFFSFFSVFMRLLCVFFGFYAVFSPLLIRNRIKPLGASSQGDYGCFGGNLQKSADRSRHAGAPQGGTSPRATLRKVTIFLKMDNMGKMGKIFNHEEHEETGRFLTLIYTD